MAITLCLPPLSEEEPLFHEKKCLSNTRNLQCRFQLPVPTTKEKVLEILDRMIQTARILNLDEVELYFVAEDDNGPFSPRNELESLNSILSVINFLLPGSGVDELEALQVLRNNTVGRIKSIGAQVSEEMVVEKCDTDAEKLLLKWGESHGVRTKLNVAYFEGAGRGAIASEYISTGETALEIPVSLIISEDLVRESDMFDVLKNLGDITAETMLLLWSMRERYKNDSRFKIYFETLPKEFRTGLSFGIDALTVLEETLLFEELLQAKEHLRQQYDALCPALCTSHPDIFEPELYTWDNFLWACELWYSNGMKVIFTDGRLRTCLVPIAGLLNHSLCPHILRYGRVDPKTKSLKFNVSRPCEAGGQCFLSYGSFPGSHLVTFYGFLPKGENPYDVIPLDFDAPADNCTGQSSNGETVRSSHMVRSTWLSKDVRPHSYGLPAHLLAHLRVVLRGDDIEVDSNDPSQQISEENERAVLETILSIFSPMMDRLTESEDFDRENSSWDVKLALDYKDKQKRIISSVLASCSAGLHELDG